MAYHIMTGVTGLLGRYLLRDLLRASVRLAVIARPFGARTARTRVDSIITNWERSSGYSLPRPVVLTGDLAKPGLGLAPGDLNWIINNCSAAIHNAASLKFLGKDRSGEPWRSNLGGTAHFLDICNAAKIEQFYHVSTAYVCGQRSGIIREDELDAGQKPANDYEASKIAAEKLVRENTKFQKVTVFRPSIIAGDSRTAYTNTFHGFYFPLKAALALSSMVPANGDSSYPSMVQSMGLSGSETKNFVPVDWVSSMIANVVTQTGLPGRTYHLTCDNPVSVSELAEVIAQAIGDWKEKASPHQDGPGTPDFATYQRQFLIQMESYRSYWRDDPIFETANIQQVAGTKPCPIVDRIMMSRWCRFAIENDFKDLQLEVREFDWDATSLLQTRFGPGTDANSLGLQINGQGGGQWRVQWSDEKIGAIEPGIGPDCRAVFYLNSHTLRAIVSKQSTPRQVWNSGRVLLEGEVQAPLQFLEQLANIEQSS